MYKRKFWLATSIVGKMRKNRSRLYDRVRERNNVDIVKRMDKIKLEKNRGTGDRLNKKCTEVIWKVG